LKQAFLRKLIKEKMLKGCLMGSSSLCTTKLLKYKTTCVHNLPLPAGRLLQTAGTKDDSWYKANRHKEDIRY